MYKVRMWWYTVSYQVRYFPLCYLYVIYKGKYLTYIRYFKR